jgi:sugar phosphate isomerase/epimerase
MPADDDSSPTRREFLGTVGALLLSAGLPSNRASLSFSDVTNLGPIGVQLYTVRGELKNDFGGTLYRVAQIGYKEVEFAGYFGHKPEDISSQLKQNGLSAPSAHVGFPVPGQDWDRAIADAVVIGHRYLVCPWIDEKYRTVDGYKQVAELFDRAGERAKSAGIQFGYHNHMYEFTPIGGQIPYDLLIAQTDPALVAMEMDVFWLRSGGGDPLDYFARFPGRFPMLHIKDMDAAKKMADVGKGLIDWKAILGKRDLAGTKHIFVEHDEPKDPFASIRDSYEYLRRLASGNTVGKRRAAG